MGGAAIAPDERKPRASSGEQWMALNEWEKWPSVGLPSALVNAIAAALEK